MFLKVLLCLPVGIIAARSLRGAFGRSGFKGRASITYTSCRRN